MIKIAFIGAGYMSEEHIKAFKNLEQVQLVGLFSRTKERAKVLAEKYSIEHIANSIEDLYIHTKPDGVVISVPELSTKEVCLKSFLFPWSLLIEKPVGLDYSEAAFLAKVAKKSKANVFVAFNRRNYGSTLKVLDELQTFDGKRIVNVLDQEDLVSAKKGGQPDAVLRNWMYANAIHIIDYFRIFLRGEIILVDAIEKWNPNIPSFVASKLMSSSGDIGIYQCQWNAPGPWSVMITTPLRRWELRPLEQLTIQDFGERKVETFEKSQMDIDFKPGLKLQAMEFIKAIQGQIAHLVSIGDSLKTMELVRNIYEF